MTWLNNIKSGIEFYILFALIGFIPLGLILTAFRRKLNIMFFLITQMAALYFCCLFALVWFPLPSAERAAELTYRAQLMPFFFIYDTFKNPSFSTILNTLFNVLMTIPFGCFLRYTFKWNFKKVLSAGFALTLFIEIGQFTGLFFLYHGSYRLFDVDDLMTNTLGACLGYLFVRLAEAYVPAVEEWDITLPEIANAFYTTFTSLETGIRVGFILPICTAMLSAILFLFTELADYGLLNAASTDWILSSDTIDRSSFRYFYIRDTRKTHNTRYALRHS